MSEYEPEDKHKACHACHISQNIVSLAEHKDWRGGTASIALSKMLQP